MKILVVFTGGTIGSSLKNEWVSLDESSRYTLISNFEKKSSKKITFDAISPYSILSENLSSCELNNLINCIESHMKNNYDGIIVTHGTDTIQYTSAALSYAFRDLNIPIVLVSANYPLEYVKSNGNDNFEAAVEFISQGAGCGVFVSYKNTFSKSVLFHYGARLLSHGENSDDLYSINDELHSYYENGKIYVNDNLKRNNKSQFIDNVTFCSNPGILVIKSRPADCYLYDLDKCSAVIFLPYHSSTLDTANPEFISFCNRAYSMGIPLFLINSRSEYIYDSSQLFKKCNIIQLPICSFPAIYMKIWLGLSQKKDLTDFLITPLANEFVL